MSRELAAAQVLEGLQALIRMEVRAAAFEQYAPSLDAQAMVARDNAPARVPEKKRAKQRVIAAALAWAQTESHVDADALRELQQAALDLEKLLRARPGKRHRS